MLLFVFGWSGCGGGGGGNDDGDVVALSCEISPAPRDPWQPFVSNPLYTRQWHLVYDPETYGRIAALYGCDVDPDATIHLSGVSGYTGKGVKVAVIDDALDLSHEDLRGAVVRIYDVATRTESVCPPDDTANHGTEVTGLIGASSNTLGIAGVAPESSIYFIRLPFEGAVTESQIVEAFEKAKAWGVDVVNCSWGSGDVSDSVKSAIEDLALNGRNSKGTVIVFAVGNGGDDRIGDPIGNDESSIEEVIAVGASTIGNRRAPYSNYGDTLDIMAPGGYCVGLTTLDQMGDAGLAPGTADYLLYDDIHAFAGTSAAAPIVTGVVALMLEADPTLTREAVRQKLITHAEKFDATSCDYNVSTGFSEYCGYGKVDADAVLTDIGS